MFVSYVEKQWGVWFLRFYLYDVTISSIISSLTELEENPEMYVYVSSKNVDN